MKQHWRSNSSFINFCSPHSPTFMGPLICFIALCFASLAIVAKLSFSPHMYLPNSPISPTFMGPLHCFVLSFVDDCGKIVIFAIFAKFAAFINFYGPLHCFVLCLVGNCGKLSFSPYLPNSPLSPTFMGPLHCFLFFLVGDCGKIVIFAIFAKFAAFANLYEPPSLLCALPRWRLWKNCHFRHICQIRHYFLFFAIFVVVCISGHITLGALEPTTTCLKNDC